MDFKNINWWKVGSIIVIIILLFLSGIYVGRKTFEPKVVTKIEYKELPPIHDTIPAPYPVKEKVDTANLIKQIVAKGLYSELFPDKEKTDTVYLTPKDTSKIINDWATERTYTEKLFYIYTVGTCTINTSVQFNRLGSIDYTFKPVQKQTTTTITEKRKYLPYAGIGISTFPTAGIEAGIFINQSWGFSIGANYYFHHGTINNIVNTTTANISLQTNATTQQDNTIIPLQTSTIEIPKFDVSLKILKMF